MEIIVMGMPPEGPESTAPVGSALWQLDQTSVLLGDYAQALYVAHGNFMSTAMPVLHRQHLTTARADGILIAATGGIGAALAVADAVWPEAQLGQVGKVAFSIAGINGIKTAGFHAALAMDAANASAAFVSTLKMLDERGMIGAYAHADNMRAFGGLYATSQLAAGVPLFRQQMYRRQLGRLLDARLKADAAPGEGSD